MENIMVEAGSDTEESDNIVYFELFRVNVFIEKTFSCGCQLMMETVTMKKSNN